MAEVIWSYIYELKEFICMSAVFIAAVALAVPRMVRKFNYRDGSDTFIYYLYQMRRREILNLAASFLEALFVLSCILFQKDIELEQLAMLAVFGLVIVVTNIQVKTVIIEILNVLLLSAALICGNIMFRYLLEIRMDGMVLAMYIVLNLFMITYTAYMCLQHMLDLKSRRKDRLAARADRAWKKAEREAEEREEELDGES